MLEVAEPGELVEIEGVAVCVGIRLTLLERSRVKAKVVVGDDFENSVPDTLFVDRRVELVELEAVPAELAPQGGQVLAN